MKEPTPQVSRCSVSDVLFGQDSRKSSRAAMGGTRGRGRWQAKQQDSSSSRQGWLCGIEVDRKEWQARAKGKGSDKGKEGQWGVREWKHGPGPGRCTPWFLIYCTAPPTVQLFKEIIGSSGEALPSSRKECSPPSEGAAQKSPPVTKGLEAFSNLGGCLEKSS